MSHPPRWSPPSQCWPTPREALAPCAERPSRWGHRAFRHPGSAQPPRGAGRWGAPPLPPTPTVLPGLALGLSPLSSPPCPAGPTHAQSSPSLVGTLLPVPRSPHSPAPGPQPGSSNEISAPSLVPTPTHANTDQQPRFWGPSGVGVYTQVLTAPLSCRFRGHIPALMQPESARGKLKGPFRGGSRATCFGGPRGNMNMQGLCSSSNETF